MVDLRKQNLEAWVVRQLEEQKINVSEGYQFRPLSGDASFRRYFRVSYLADDQPGGETKTLLAVDAPPENEDSHAFVDIDQLLAKMGAIVPAIIAVDYAAGYLMVSDFGDDLFYQLRNHDDIDALYLCAIDTLLNIQKSKLDLSLLPVYSKELLQTELDLFSEWFVQGLLQLDVDEQTKDIIKNCQGLLIEGALQQPQAFVHRDYHSRNLLSVNEAQPALIDFQGAVVGPITYDLVSLLKDCYIYWPVEKQHVWKTYFYQQALSYGLLGEATSDEFQRWFDLMGLQRHIKVLVIFARLHCRDHKSGYLNDLPLVIHYVRQVIQAYDDFEGFSHWFESILMPIIETAEWYEPLSE